MTSLVFLLAWIAAGAAHAAPAERNACDLLTADDIRGVQQVAVTERKPSAVQRQGLRFAQCVYATADFARSVSLSLITGADEKAVRVYWEKTFRPQKASTRKNPPRALEGAGEEAFWSGDARAGTLYVLGRGAILRISVGGVTDEDERMRRSRRLAEAALRRLAP